MTTSADYNIAIHVPPQGVGSWRELYLQLLDILKPNSLVEIGAGSPEFLIQANAKRLCAIDGGDRWAGEFKDHGIEFIQMDLDNDELPNTSGFDVAVCSDVFEHLVFPKKTLLTIKRLLNEGGILLSHVPNEFRILNVLKIMFGVSDSVIYHPHCKEYENPHLRRFTKRGFLEFLQTEFKHNIYLSDIKYDAKVKFIRLLGFSVPYFMEPGPTYLSTNSDEAYEKFKFISKKMV